LRFATELARIYWREFFVEKLGKSIRIAWHLSAENVSGVRPLFRSGAFCLLPGHLNKAIRRANPPMWCARRGSFRWLHSAQGALCAVPIPPGRHRTSKAGLEFAPNSGNVGNYGLGKSQAQRVRELPLKSACRFGNSAAIRRVRFARSLAGALMVHCLS
jgi:hypothetical protein